MWKKPCVYLVGAGPGDAGLLTCKGLELIKNCDVVVYDRLVSKEIMALIPEETEKINVGKNVGDHPVPQWRINEILLEEAQKGKRVVRLKGGDPFVFGRGGEELELLVENNIEFQVVPGITSSIAAPGYGGIPVTHRDYCSSLHIITGHGKNDSEAEINYDALVGLNGTLVFMMSVSTSATIAENLIRAGMDKNMPAALVENGTYGKQRKLITTLEKLGETVIRENVKSPAVILVGKVCSLGDKFDWFDKLPLKGRKILVTQPKSKASTLAEKIKSLGGEAVLYPTIRTKWIRPISPDVRNFDIVGFTSEAGVRSFMEYLKEEGLDSRELHGLDIAVVGPATARALEEYGIKADFIPEKVFDGKTMGLEMVKEGFALKHQRVILLRAKEASRDIVTVLRDAAIEVEDYPVYETEYIMDNDVGEPEDFDIITFTSKSCVDGFVKTRGKTDFTGVKALCIGKQTAAAAEEYNFDITVSEMATIDSMVEKLEEIL